MDFTKKRPREPKDHIVCFFFFVARHMQPVQNVHWPGLLPPVQPQFWQPGQQPMVSPYQAPPNPVTLGSLSTGVPSASVGSGTRSDNCDDEDDDQDQSQSSFLARVGVGVGTTIC